MQYALSLLNVVIPNNARIDLILASHEGALVFPITRPTQFFLEQYSHASLSNILRSHRIKIFAKLCYKMINI